VHKELREPKVNKEFKGRKEHRAPKEFKENKESRVFKEFKVSKARRVCKEFKELRGTQGIQGLKGTHIVSSTTPPSSPSVDDLWWNSDLGILMIYYYDGDSYQWVTTSSGIVGPQGAQGTIGSQGTAGTQGASGFNGAQGSQGLQGIQGLTGSQGTQGVQGEQGVQGIQGISGYVGSDGAQGTQGIQGTQGAQGITGTQGTQGAQGIQGSQGTQGAQGIQGIQGISGASILGTNNTWTGTNAFGTLSASGSVTVSSSTTLAAGDPSIVLQGVSNTERLHIRSALGAVAGQPVMLLAAARGTIASPTAVQDGDDLGFLQLGGYNGTTYRRGAWIAGKAEGAHSATSSGTAILFQTTENGSVAMTERMRITGSGNVGIGTTSPSSSKLVIEADGTSFGTYGSTINLTAASGTRYHIIFRENGTERGSITSNGTTAAYNSVSDHRLKEITGPITDSGSFIDALKPKVGTWKADGSSFVGFIAHEFAEVSPTSVSGEKDAVDAEGNPKYQSMQASSAEVIANLVAELQSLRARVAALESK
jgi:hypothetical protein